MLARWSSWGAVPDVFDEYKDSWASERTELKSLLSDDAYAEARRTTINAHYTDPAYVREIWAALTDLGFDGGQVLEPGAGSGTFIGLAPEGARMTGIELDSTTALIASGLYPQAEIRAESFADSRFPTGYFDAAVGNVPFADVRLHDPAHNAGRHSIHNHFIIKALALTRPGGLVAVLTSHYTLDAQNPSARREMNAMADLVGAVRLPSGAHRRAAGTDVVTDLLVFRRREIGEPAVSQLWETVTAQQVDERMVKINSYFDQRPENILGDVHVGTGMYGNDTLTVTAADLANTPVDLRTALSGVVADATAAGQRMTARSAHSERALATYRPAEPTQWDGTIVDQHDGTFTVVRAGVHTALKVPKNAATELTALLGLRDGTTALLALEAATVDDTDEIVDTRAILRTRYDDYQTRYGPLNRFTLRSTGRDDPDTGEAGTARITPTPARLLRADPFGPLVMALERFDEERQTASPAAMLKQRVVAQRLIAQGADTPAEAITLSLDRTGRIDLDSIAHLLGQTEADARAGLGEMVYDDPTTGNLIHAPEYLSGDVRIKLDAAQAAAETQPERFAVNVAALQAAMPEKLTMEQIQARLGAVWVDADTHQQFLRELLRDRSIRVENPMPGMWEVRGNRQTLRATSEWGTVRRPATMLTQALMEQKPITVFDEYEEMGSKKRVVNALETTAAQEKADQLQERFGEWVWETPERAERLTDEYNRRFNSIALRDYSHEGDYLTLPGVALNFVPRPHQRAAVARMLSEPAVGLFHQVGAGKTAEMVMGTMELGRMGLVTKPVVVVPNHMLEQFAREWLQIYPQARILASSSDDLAGDKRRLFVARAAANDWDAIIMTRTAFQRIPLSPIAEAGYISRELDTLRAVFEEATGEDAMSVKRIEKKLLSLEQTYKDLTDKPRDAGITFESTGIDYVVVDEMHDYKNLATESSIQDARIAGAGRATDLHMKLEYLRSRHGDRVVTVATATPLANSITEAYVMQRYLRPDLLENAGIGHFDAWAATFGQTVTEMEMAPTGGGNFRLKTRFAKFQNVPEMLRMWHVFADVKTAEDLKLPTPLLRERSDGQRVPENLVLQPGPELEAYIADIGERAERVANKSVRPEEDNMLKISTDGRKAALDVRMVGGDRPNGPTKIDAVAHQVLRIWNETKDLSYLDDVTKEPSPTPGALQLVFSDLGTPKPDRWNAYDELRLKLVDGGMPAEAIRYIHEAKTDPDKARLFAAARAGHVAVLVGSTAKMGVGTNVQARAIALHHMDCPWRPADIEQRDGRIVRQGNQNAEVGLYRYVVERSFDSYMWQTVERKAKFISQIMRGRLDMREIEDIGDVALGAAETKALSSGNPLLMEQSVANNDVSRLQRLERAWQRNQTNLVSMRVNASSQVGALDRDIGLLTAALPSVVDTSDDLFRMTVAGRQYGKRADAGIAIGEWAARNGVRYLPTNADRKLGELGQVGGFPIDVASRTSLGQVHIVAELRGVPGASVTVPRNQFAEAGVGLVRQLENRASSLPKLITETQQKRVDVEATITEVDTRVGDPFKHGADLREAQERQARVVAGLAAMATEQNLRAEGTDAPGVDGASAARERIKELAARTRAQADEYHVDPDSAPRIGPISQRPRV
ncbi:helicase [Cryobacterium melibiosiphilum]|uniref:Helicase n=1 Tax=Cryobacterium melibiosiphilum TaxID=995039 RepID=A0A3A5MYF5_9MICO|nr:helicase [Cryobacterium melibiosiphilum]RJT90184.1 helicase [Cryobacterium melibiosiphilum]